MKIKLADGTQAELKFDKENNIVMQYKKGDRDKTKILSSADVVRRTGKTLKGIADKMKERGQLYKEIKKELKKKK